MKQLFVIARQPGVLTPNIVGIVKVGPVSVRIFEALRIIRAFRRDVRLNQIGLPELIVADSAERSDIDDRPARLFLTDDARQHRGLAIAKQPDLDAGMSLLERLNHLLVIFDRRRCVPNHLA